MKVRTIVYKKGSCYGRLCNIFEIVFPIVKKAEEYVFQR